ncbi:hypothetical protein DL763_003385 [Monosporascus cannonballus]|nr:hypothetical protein DL763_003385 [Monosporascus cannonballus]
MAEADGRGSLPTSIISPIILQRAELLAKVVSVFMEIAIKTESAEFGTSSAFTYPVEASLSPFLGLPDAAMLLSDEVRSVPGNAGDLASNGLGNFEGRD